MNLGPGTWFGAFAPLLQRSWYLAVDTRDAAVQLDLTQPVWVGPMRETTSAGTL